MVFRRPHGGINHYQLDEVLFQIRYLIFHIVLTMHFGES